MEMLIERGDVVGSILTGKGAHQLNDRDTSFCERAEWLIKCAEASRRIRPIVEKRWKIPIRFDPQSRLTQWAVAQKLDLSETNVHFERDFASCMPDFAPSRGNQMETEAKLDSERDLARCVWDVVLSRSNRKGQLRLQLFQRWHAISKMQEALQREEELKWILQEARKAELPDDILKDIESKLRESQEKLQKDRFCTSRGLWQAKTDAGICSWSSQILPDGTWGCRLFQLWPVWAPGWRLEGIRV